MADNKLAKLMKNGWSYRSGGGGAQSNFDAVEGEQGHILNRPFGYKETVIFEEAELEFAPFVDLGVNLAIFEPTSPITPNTKYTITYDGVEYECVSDGEGETLGNLDALLGAGDTGEPFVISVFEYPKYGLIALDGREAGSKVTFKLAGIVYELISPDLVATRDPFVLHLFEKKGTYYSLTAEQLLISLISLFVIIYGFTEPAMTELETRLKRAEPILIYGAARLPGLIGINGDDALGASTLQGHYARPVARDVENDTPENRRKYWYCMDVGANARAYMLFDYSNEANPKLLIDTYAFSRYMD